MERGEEDLACVAYTRWVTDVGGREDWFGLQVAMMPCLFGYGVIARRLFDDKTTKRGIPLLSGVVLDGSNGRGKWVFPVDTELCCGGLC